MQPQLIRDIIKFLLLFAFWIILSERLQWRYLITGAVCSLAVVLITRRIGLRHAPNETSPPAQFRWLHFLFQYLPWLAWQVVMANIQVATMILRNNPPLDPVVVELPVKMQRSTAQVLFANSITLTPGTITVDIKDGTAIVHALSKESCGSLLTHELHNRVAAIFSEQPVTGTTVEIRNTFHRRWTNEE